MQLNTYKTITDVKGDAQQVFFLGKLIYYSMFLGLRRLRWNLFSHFLGVIL
jgi:hypothetical protein